jgi:hypothetical protein
MSPTVPDSEQHPDFAVRGKYCANFLPGLTYNHMTQVLRGTKMIYKAAENFKERTLSALPTLLERLAYVCSLQLPDGGYRHWGLSRTYGLKPAQEAIYLSHTELAIELVHSPVQDLYEEYKRAIGREDGPEILKAESFVLNAPVNDDGLLGAHLRLLEDSVKTLARQERTTPQVA